MVIEIAEPSEKQEIGNEIVMEGMKIVHDKLNSAFDNEELYFYMES